MAVEMNVVGNAVVISQPVFSKSHSTCVRLFSIVFSSSALAAADSCWWVCLKCSMADAWMWFSSDRREADGKI